MAAGRELARAFVRVQVEDGGVKGEITKITQSAVDDAGTSAARTFISRFRQVIASQGKTAVSGLSSDADTSGQDAGEQAGRSFIERVRDVVRRDAAQAMAGLDDQAGAAGTDAGEKAERSFIASLRSGLASRARAAFASLDTGATTAGGDAGQAAERGFVARFGDGIRSRAKTAFSSLAVEARAAGERAGDEFTRGADGRLRDGQGRYVAAGRAAGDAGTKGMVAGLAGGAAAVSRAAGALGAIGGGYLAAGFIKSSVSIRAAFEDTLNQLGAVAKVPAADIERLSRLALQMGADTVFSANQAAEAMLELARGGLTAAQIEAGGLAGTLTLAAAGGLDMGRAATIASNAMSAFGLGAKDVAAVAAALAGGANASTASVDSLAQALSQVGPGAVNAGLSLQETVAVLAAFDAAGIKGSDAGTSLKTMLTRLIPASMEADATMKALGLSFVDVEGNIVPITQVAGQLQTALSGLSEAQRIAALNTIFGADATRAASVLMKEGAAGLAGYIAATNDMGAAQEVAAARMRGLPGALEQLSGSFETAKLAVGGFLAPAVTAGAGLLTQGLNQITTGVLKLSDSGSGLSRVSLGIKGIKDLLVSGDLNSAFAAAFNISDQSPSIANLTKIRTAVIGLKDSFTTNLLPSLQQAGAQIAPALQSLGASLLGFLTPLIQKAGEIGGQLMAVLGPGIREIANLFSTQLVPAIQAVLPVLAPVAQFLLGVIGTALVGALKGVINVIKGVLQIVSGILNVFAGIFTGDWSRMWEGIKQIATGLLQGILGIIQTVLNVGVLGAIKKFISGALAFFQALGPAAVGLVRSMASGIQSLITGMANAGLSLVGRLVTGAVSLFTSLGSRAASLVSSMASRVISSGTSMASGLVSAITSGASRVIAQVTSLASRVVSLLQALPGRVASIGGQIVSGIANGISNAAGRVMSAVSSLVDRIPAAIRKLMGISSPSRVMARLARWIPEGLAVGITANAGAAVGAARDLAARAAEAAKSRFGDIGRIAFDAPTRIDVDQARGPQPPPTQVPAGGAASAEDIASALRDALRGVTVVLDRTVVGKVDTLYGRGY